MSKTVINIKGMHCRSCELLVEDELLKVPGVTSVMVSQKKGCAEVNYKENLSLEAVRKAVNQAGYELGKAEDKPFFSRDPNVYMDTVICGVVLFIIFFIANDMGIFKLVNSTSGSFSSLPIVFLIGLTAGLSTCMAIVGGLILGASARFAEKHPEATSLQKFKPHLFFNLGRITSYFILGGIIGYAGSFFQISSGVLGTLTIVVGLVMLILGAQLTELFPRLSSLSFTLPKGISRILGIKKHHEKEYSHKNSFTMGALTFFLPCGFTQAMQLFAISSGSPLTGALTMGIFALGTAPGLLGIGGLTAIIRGAFAKTFFKFAGLVVIALAIFNISNGYNLTGLSVLASFNGNTNARITDSNVTLENGTQIVRMTQSSSGYSPNSFTIKKGIPVRWIINSTDPYSCAASIISSKLGIRQGLQEGENIIEFTPQEVGSIRFSCSMGMYTGAFNVVDENGNGGERADVQAPQGASGGSCGSGGCGCGSGAAKKFQPQANVTPAQPTIIQANNQAAVALVPQVIATPTLTITPTPTIEVTPTPTPEQVNTIQVLKATYTQTDDIKPNQFILQGGIPARLEIEAKDDGYGCMGSMALPGLSEKIDVFQSGKTMVFEFTPTRGKYYMTCGMGIPRGLIEVN